MIKKLVDHSNRLLIGSLICYTLTVTTVKISLLLLYRRIFATTLFKRLTTAVGVACIIWSLINITMIIFQLRPVFSAFNPRLATNRWLDFRAFWTGITGSNVALDMVILGLPLCMVYGLQLPIKQKLLLTGTFALGAL